MLRTSTAWKKSLRQHKVSKLSGFGEKTEQTLLQGIELLKKSASRFLYIHAMPVVEEISKFLSRHDFVEKVEVAGSYRRRKETIGDLDFLAVSSQPEKVMDIFTRMKDVKDVLAKGTTKSSVRLGNNMQIDLRVVQKKEFGSALLYFIGSKEHNIELRKLSLKQGYTLNEYGLFSAKGKKWVAGRTEREIYQKLGLHYMEPELRENRGEIGAARQGALPKLVAAKDIHGVFHNHSAWSDGNNSLLEMARKAEELKLKFISFNDHFGSIGITNPLNEKRLRHYLQEIGKIQKKVVLKSFFRRGNRYIKRRNSPSSGKKIERIGCGCSFCSSGA